MAAGPLQASAAERKVSHIKLIVYTSRASRCHFDTITLDEEKNGCVARD